MEIRCGCEAMQKRDSHCHVAGSCASEAVDVNRHHLPDGYRGTDLGAAVCSARALFEAISRDSSAPHDKPTSPLKRQCLLKTMTLFAALLEMDHGNMDIFRIFDPVSVNRAKLIQR